MFTRNKQINTTLNQISPMRFIENINDIQDYANSELLYMLDDEDHRSEYTITTDNQRIDLIANNIYGSDEYSWILLYINRLSVEDLTRGKVIQYIPKEYLDTIFSII